FYEPETIRVAPFRGDVQYEESRTFRTVSNLALGDPVTFATPPDRQFSGGPLTLTDGIFGTPGMETPFYDGTWDGWQGVDMDARIDLQQPTLVHSVDARFLQYGSAGIRAPSYVWFETSDDGVHWKLVDSLAPQGSSDDAHPGVRNARFAPKAPITTRHVRVIAAPDDAVGPGSPWLVSDEIIVQ
ncbi:MAG: discoidin domain-containing protein, partial [Rhodanobacteraceae bacterium]